MNKNQFYQQTELLVAILPFMTKDTNFALHGGTAINFFVRNMPRISVDIDLTYLRIDSRKTMIDVINEQLRIISNRISSSITEVQVEEIFDDEKNIFKLLVRRKNALVKIEPNQVIRGSLFGYEERDICQKAEEVFEKYATARILSFAGLYGSKICAALDRQHPRDIFDIKLLLENEGITEEVRKAFIVYLISHNRPMAELLAPNYKNIKTIYENEFSGMPLIDIRYEDLMEVRKSLVEQINKLLTENERAFLISFKEKKPDWGLLNIQGVQELPAVKWKLANLEKMDDEKHREAVQRLKRILSRV